MDGIPPDSYDRCPKCRYDIRRITEAVCPECGGSIKPEDIRRAIAANTHKRRGLWALGAFLLSPIVGLLLTYLGYFLGAWRSIPSVIFFPVVVSAALFVWHGQDPSRGPSRRFATMLVAAPLLSLLYAYVLLLIFATV